MFDDELTAEEKELLQSNQLPDEKVEPEPTPEPGDFLKEPEGEPAPEPEPKPTDEWKEKYENMLAMNREERKLRQQYQDRLDKITDRIMQMQEKRELEDKPKPPDYETDPIGHQQYRIHELEQRLAQTSQQTQEQAEQVSRQAQYMQIMDAYQKAEAVFSRENPDFADARRYLMAHRDNELIELNERDPARRAQILRNDEANIIFQSFANNSDPAATIYRLAKLRGYMPNSKEKHIPDQKGPKSLSTVRGGTSKPTTLQDKVDKILSMSDKDFAKIPDADLETLLQKI